MQRCLHSGHGNFMNSAAALLRHTNRTMAILLAILLLSIIILIATCTNIATVSNSIVLFVFKLIISFVAVHQCTITPIMPRIVEMMPKLSLNPKP